MLKIAYDEAAGIILTTAMGMSTAEEYDAYCLTFEDYMERSSARHGSWLHLVDATANPIQQRTQADHLETTVNSFQRRDGYVAYVITSALAKLQIQRTCREVRHKDFFADEPSARAWLLAQVGLGEASASGF